MPPVSRHAYPIGLAVVVAVGLALRVLAARGGLWLDEAWSASFARDVGTPLGVFVSIHHDNNHHLNTLWMQLVGFGAPPVVQRGLSILTGTAAIMVAAHIARRQGIVAALATAALFAVSPILVTYGSEARGYAPMVLALLTLVLVADRWLTDRTQSAPIVAMAALCVLGVLSQMTMVFGILAIGGWLIVRAGPRHAFPPVVAMVAAGALTVAAILLWLPGPEGFGFGAYQPYALRHLADGLRDMVAYTLGLPRSDWVLLLPALLLAIALRLRDGMAPLHILTVAGLPAGIALLHIGNAGMARYYLVGTISLLLLAGTTVSTAKRGWRVAAFAALLATVALSIVQDIGMIANRRADPGHAVDLILAGEPSVTLDRPRAAPVIESAAAVRGRPVRITPCAPWLFVDRDGTEPFPPAPEVCGHTYLPVARGDPTGLSGTHWRLYRRDRRCAEARPAA